MPTPDRNKTGEFLALVTPYLWTAPSTEEDCRQYADVEIQVIGTPSVAYVPQRSFDGNTFVTCNAYDKDGTASTTIAAAGFYTIKGGAMIKLATGSGSVVYIRKGS